MMLWLVLAVCAYFLLAVNGVADKFLLSKAVKHPVTYAFYAGITGPFTVALALVGLLGRLLGVHFLANEFSLQFLSFSNTLIALAGGACFPLALVFLYRAIQMTSVSRVLPSQGGLVPVFTFVFAYFILGERLSAHQTFAFLFLVAGAVLIGMRKDKGSWHPVAFSNGLLAAGLFAMSFILEKYIFYHVNFGSGLIWTRFGFFIPSAIFFIIPDSRKHIVSAPKEVSTGNKFVYLGARISGSLAGLAQNYAIKLGSVTLVNSMQGVQYVFLLALTTVLSLRFPRILKERVNRQTITQKIIAVVLVCAGLAFLAL